MHSHKKHDTRQSTTTPKQRSRQKTTRPIPPTPKKTRPPTRHSTRNLRSTIPNQDSTKNTPNPSRSRSQRRIQRLRHRKTTHHPPIRIPGHQTQTIHTPSLRKIITQSPNPHPHRTRPTRNRGENTIKCPSSNTSSQNQSKKPKSTNSSKINSKEQDTAE